MATIEELRKKIQQQKNINAGIKEMRELALEKEKLEKEYVRLKKENTRKTNWAKIGGELKTIGNNILDVANRGREELEKRDKKRGLF